MNQFLIVCEAMSCLGYCSHTGKGTHAAAESVIRVDLSYYSIGR